MLPLRNHLGTDRKLLLISSPGGHMSELWRIERSLGVNKDSIWITSRNEQTEELLHGRRVVWVPYVAPRDWRGSYGVSKIAAKLARQEEFFACLSTGAALAALALPRVALNGLKTIYVESLARALRPSATGRIAKAIPQVETWAQQESLCLNSSSWQYSGTVLDDYVATPKSRSADKLRILVTLGTIEPYRFDRAVATTLDTIRTMPNVEVTWQLGSTKVDGLPGTTYSTLSVESLKSHMQQSDVVVGHAGVGTLLDALEAGVSPILLPRSGDLNEHVDSHQFELAEGLRHQGLAKFVLPNDPLTPEKLLQAAQLRIERKQDEYASPRHNH